MTLFLKKFLHFMHIRVHIQCIYIIIIWWSNWGTWYMLTLKLLTLSCLWYMLHLYIFIFRKLLLLNKTNGNYSYNHCQRFMLKWKREREMLSICTLINSPNFCFKIVPFLKEQMCIIFINCGVFFFLNFILVFCLFSNHGNLLKIMLSCKVRFKPFLIVF